MVPCFNWTLQFCASTSRNSRVRHKSLPTLAHRERSDRDQERSTGRKLRGHGEYYVQYNNSNIRINESSFTSATNVSSNLKYTNKAGNFGRLTQAKKQNSFTFKVLREITSFE